MTLCLPVLAAGTADASAARRAAAGGAEALPIGPASADALAAAAALQLVADTALRAAAYAVVFDLPDADKTAGAAPEAAAETGADAALPQETNLNCVAALPFRLVSEQLP